MQKYSTVIAIRQLENTIKTKDHKVIEDTSAGSGEYAAKPTSYKRIIRLFEDVDCIFWYQESRNLASFSCYYGMTSCIMKKFSDVKKIFYTLPEMPNRKEQEEFEKNRLKYLVNFNQKV